MRIYTSEKFTFSHCSKYDSDNVFVRQCMCVCVCVSVFVIACYLTGLLATSVSLAWTRPTRVPSGAFSSTSKV